MTFKVYNFGSKQPYFKRSYVESVPIFSYTTVTWNRIYNCIWVRCLPNHFVCSHILATKDDYSWTCNWRVSNFDPFTFIVNFNTSHCVPLLSDTFERRCFRFFDILVFFHRKKVKDLAWMVRYTHSNLGRSKTSKSLTSSSPRNLRFFEVYPQKTSISQTSIILKIWSSISKLLSSSSPQTLKFFSRILNKPQLFRGHS